MNKKRLLKLADHLMRGKLGHKKFDFSTYNSFSPNNPSGCGTNGCAIGECPIVFPRQWKFAKGSGAPILRCEDTHYEQDSGQIFFDVGMREYEHLFIPEMQNPSRFGGVHPGFKATRKQVARNILPFVKKMERTKGS